MTVFLSIVQVPDHGWRFHEHRAELRVHEGDRESNADVSWVNLLVVYVDDYVPRTYPRRCFTFMKGRQALPSWLKLVSLIFEVLFPLRVITARVEIKYAYINMR